MPVTLEKYVPEVMKALLEIEEQVCANEGLIVTSDAGADN